MYKIGATSYIYPEDMLSNVLKLRERVCDIELLFFESGYFPDYNIISKLKKISYQEGLSYTVHLPLDPDIASSSRITRKNSLKEISFLIKKTKCLKPLGYILHIKGFKTDNSNLIQWQKRAMSSIKQIVQGASIKPSQICVENLDYPMEFLDEIIKDLGISICLDIGHLQQYEFDIKQYFRKYIGRTRVIHFYGLSDLNLHSSLKKVDMKVINWLKKYLLKVKYSGILTLEVFSESDLNISLKIMKGGEKNVKINNGVKKVQEK